jgi:hypothetical protein
VSLKPFFSFYGAKWRSAPHYPPPTHRTIIEPFAGSAGYAVRHHDRAVVLVDADPIIAGLWRYLIDVSAAEVRALPSVVEHVDEIVGPQEARWLVGFWLNKGTESPRLRPSAGMRRLQAGRPGTFWGEVIRERIASQVEQIRHWRVIEGDYSTAPDIEATWLIDPPYADKGSYYRVKFSRYDELGAWCRTRRGQVIACEQHGATWLPFRTLDARTKSTRGVSHEVVWTGARSA